MFRNTWIKYLLFILLVSGCKIENTSTNNGAIETLMQSAKAWNNGDLKAYMSAYKKSDSLTFVGGKKVNFGWENTLQRYQKSYPTKSSMGHLDFLNTKIEYQYKDAALVSGKWQLLRISDTLQGRFTVFMRKVEGHWKIIYDHSS